MPSGKGTYGSQVGRPKKIRKRKDGSPRTGEKIGPLEAGQERASMMKIGNIRKLVKGIIKGPHS